MQVIEEAIGRAIRFRDCNALITETFDLARQQAAAALDRGLTPFPVVVKDCFTLQSQPTTCASKSLVNFRPPYTATTVQRLIDKGGCVIGKSNHDEFSMGTSSLLGYFGPVRNGIKHVNSEQNSQIEGEENEDDFIVAGGSSGGAAVAVQLGMADVGIASDTGGSIRNPAAFTGVFGLKPTYGLLSRSGLVPLVNSLDSPSILCQSASKCLEYLKMMHNVDENDSTSNEHSDKGNSFKSLKGLRIGIPKEFHDENLSLEGWQVWNRAANRLAKAGARIVSVSLPSSRFSLNTYHVICAADVASNMARYDGVAFGHRSEISNSTHALYAATRSESLNSVVRKRIFAGNYFLMRRHRKEYFERALLVRRVIASELCSVLSSLDLLLVPSASGSAPRFSELWESNYMREHHDDFYTQSANLAGKNII
ncbi:hypothetical protein WR25_00875 [Diploscapter pachys]|uniref:Amidase domain-containing protein n=1 Tax=Diploscapter pachys TaxID=2018661 RepID=A0A2A2KVV4_9BILA|nr:hypothetical protein WR25_00875 [Diploscapter pachys]